MHWDHAFHRLQHKKMCIFEPLSVDLFCNQKDFLIACGIQKRKANLQKNKSKKTIKNLNLEYERLIDKSQMGETFKVLVVSCL